MGSLHKNPQFTWKLQLHKDLIMQQGNSHKKEILEKIIKQINTKHENIQYDMNTYQYILNNSLCILEDIKWTGHIFNSYTGKCFISLDHYCWTQM